MEVIRAVSQYGSVTEAAGALGISQPAISMMLRDCALQAGFPFFVRKRGRLQATHETRQILAELNRVFESIERVNCLVDEMHDVTSGTVQVATSATLADNLVAPASAIFQRAWPHIQISVSVLDNLSVSDRVSKEHVDFGIVLSPLNHHDGRQVDARLIDICAARLVCIVHPDSPLASRSVVRPRDLAAYPLISFDKSLPLGALIENSYRSDGVERSIAFKVTLTAMAYSLVRAGAGAAIIDPFYQLSQRDDGVATLRYEPETEVKVQILLPNNTPLSRPARLFMDVLREEGEFLKELQSQTPEAQKTKCDGVDWC
jgi:DNA-binding transcriptional LysR family regulator